MNSLRIATAIRGLIEADLKKNPESLYVIARRYGVTKSRVERIRDEMMAPNADLVAAPVTVSLDPSEVPEHLLPYLVEAKPVCTPWSMSEEMKKARDDYDEGTVELVTGRIRRTHGDVLVLYRIPRKRVDTRRRPYFSATYEG